VLRVGGSHFLQVGYKERHLEKGISPVVENKETSRHSRIKSLGGLPGMKETRAGRRNKRKKFCKNSTISHELPMFKEKRWDSEEKPSVGREEAQIA